MTHPMWGPRHMSSGVPSTQLSTFTFTDDGNAPTYEILQLNQMTSALTIFASQSVTAGKTGLYDDCWEILLIPEGQWGFDTMPTPASYINGTHVAAAWLWGDSLAARPNFSSDSAGRGDAARRRRWVLQATGPKTRWLIAARPGFVPGLTTVGTVSTLSLTAMMDVGAPSLPPKVRIDSECTAPPFQFYDTGAATPNIFPNPARQTCMDSRVFRTLAFTHSVAATSTSQATVAGGPWNFVWNGYSPSTLRAEADDDSGELTTPTGLWGLNVTSWIFANPGNASLVDRPAPLERTRLGLVNSSGAPISTTNFIQLYHPGGDR